MRASTLLLAALLGLAACDDLAGINPHELSDGAASDTGSSGRAVDAGAGNADAG